MGYNEETLDEANVWWHSNQTNRLIYRVSQSTPLAWLSNRLRLQLETDFS